MASTQRSLIFPLPEAQPLTSQGPQLDYRHCIHLTNRCQHQPGQTLASRHLDGSAATIVINEDDQTAEQLANGEFASALVGRTRNLMEEEKLLRTQQAQYADEPQRTSRDNLSDEQRRMRRTQREELDEIRASLAQAAAKVRAV